MFLLHGKKLFFKKLYKKLALKKYTLDKCSLLCKNCYPKKHTIKEEDVEKWTLINIFYKENSKEFIILSFQHNYGYKVSDDVSHLSESQKKFAATYVSVYKEMLKKLNTLEFKVKEDSKGNIMFVGTILSSTIYIFNDLRYSISSFSFDGFKHGVFDGNEFKYKKEVSFVHLLGLIEKNKDKKEVLRNLYMCISYKEDKVDNLYARLCLVRNKISEKDRIRLSSIFRQRELDEIVEKRPKNEEEFLKIKGVGKIKVKKYAKLFLKEINK